MANTEQRIVVDQIVTACASLFAATSILDKKVSEKLLTDSALPALCISEVKTIYNKQQFRDLEENYEIRLVIVIADDADPLNALTNIQGKVIKALLALPQTGGMLFTIKESTVSNVVEQFSFGSGISCVLSVTCSKVVSYNP
jgi:hypothetical protein